MKDLVLIFLLQKYGIISISQVKIWTPLFLHEIWNSLYYIYGILYIQCSSVQSSSVAQSYLTICDPINHSMPVLPVHHQLPESTQTQVYWVGDAIQPPHPLLSPSPPALNLSQHQGLFKWVSSPHQMAKILEFQLHHQSLQWTLRADLI